MFMVCVCVCQKVRRRRGGRKGKGGCLTNHKVLPLSLHVFFMPDYNKCHERIIVVVYERTVYGCVSFQFQNRKVSLYINM